jgi:hypothetical protein
MATALLPARVSTTTSRTVRQFQRALVVTGVAIAVGCALYLVETFLVRPHRRVVENPVEVMMRVLGLAHFVVGWLFLFTSPKLRNVQALGRLSGLVILGVVLCLLFALGGAMRNPVLLLLFYGYFLIHEVRDEATLYQRYGDDPFPNNEGQAFLGLTSWAVAAWMTSVLLGVFLLQANALDRLQRYSSLGIPLALAGFVLLLLTATALSHRAARLGCRAHGGVREAFRTHRPLFSVYAGLLTILIVGSLFGSAGFHLIILVHVSAWMVFVAHQLGRQPASSTRSRWSWCRTTPAGFVSLHLAIAALMLVLMGLRVYVWERAGIVSELLARASFPYWSLLHITMAFWKGR